MKLIKIFKPVVVVLSFVGGALGAHSYLRRKHIGCLFLSQASL
jgi:hypothetical protein